VSVVENRADPLRTRFALSGILSQIGSNTLRTAALSIALIGLLPICGKTWRSKLYIHDA